MTAPLQMKRAFLALAFAVGIGAATSARAAEETPPLPDQNWSFEGVFGTFDRAALQRGLQVYLEVCAACHGLDHLYYRNLSALGYSEDEIKAIAANYEVTDGPNDEGEMFTRPALPSDRFVNPYPNPQAARAANNGALPVDLSMVVKARMGGADYVYALLTGYTDPPEGFQLLDGLHYNPYFSGKQIAMTPPLSDGLVTYADGTEATVPQMARDVVTFLAWAAEPEMEARKSLGIKVILFLLVLAAILYALKRRIWSDVH